MRPKIILAVIELTAKIKKDKNLLPLLLKSINNNIKNKENWIITTDQCMILIVLDLVLKSLLTCVIKPKRIQDPTPYPMTTVKINIRVSVSSVT